MDIWHLILDMCDVLNYQYDFRLDNRIVLHYLVRNFN